jgi:manganese/iron transport system ATP-binding protein
MGLTMTEFTYSPIDHDTSAPPITVEDIRVTYNGHDAIRDVSFEVQPGRRVAVVGPNGAGKTTLFQVIAGAIKPTSGTISIFGHRPGGHVCIAYVPQRSQVDWSFPASVTDVVMMGRVRKIGLFRWPRRADWSFAQQAMRRVGITDLARQQIGELSGGQQQRVFLAQALTQEAEIILLDEPLTGLDLPSQEAIFDILDDLQRAGVTILVATHDLNLAAERFDDVLLINRHSIAYGSPQEVFSQPYLLEAYGGHVHVLEEDGGLMLLTDSCCEGEEHIHHE